MPRVAPAIPAESDRLCERCGYTLNGLPDDSRCPECGSLIAENIGTGRRAPAWESTGYSPIGFLRTTAEIIFRPTHFYRTFATRLPVEGAWKFTQVHWAIASALFGLAAFGHFDWYVRAFNLDWLIARSRFYPWGFAALLVALTYLFLRIITCVAAKLTTLEAAYRGLRLPLGVVLRGMYYHGAHYLPVSLCAAVTVFGYRWLLAARWVPDQSESVYLYTLCGEVVVLAGYLFHTYWIGMRNMMFANR